MMRKMLVRMGALAVSVLLMSSTFGASTSEAALGCNHVMVKQGQFYETLFPHKVYHAKCPGTWYDWYEKHYRTYFGCKNCEYVVFDGGTDEIVGHREVKHHTWNHFFICPGSEVHADDEIHKGNSAIGIRG